MKLKPPPIRFWIAVMIFMTTFTNYMMRSNMSVSIVSMVEKSNKSKIKPPCPHVGAVKPKEAEKTGDRFEWSEAEQGHILSAYFWGYMLTSMPAGIISEMVGPWIVILVTSVGAALLTGLTPLAAHGAGFAGVVSCRFFIGLLGGFTYPAINVLIARWAPPKEKGKFLAAMMGNTLGTVCTWPLVGTITFNFGWEWGFYCLDAVMVVYCVVFFFLVSDSPLKHRWISEEEQQYIAAEQEGNVSTKKAIPPYLKILTSVPFWALCFAQFGNLWGLNLILTYAPKYLAQTLGFNIRDSGGLAAMPYLARLFMSIIFGSIGDYMRKKEIMGVTRIRKFFIIFSHLLPSVGMFLILLTECNWAFVVALLVINQGLNGAVVVSHLVNPQDLAPNFAGTLYGTMNFVAGTTGFIVPAITGAFLAHYNTSDTPLAGPYYIFGIGGAMFALSGLIFIIFGSGKMQSWNEKKEDKPVEMEET